MIYQFDGQGRNGRDGNRLHGCGSEAWTFSFPTKAIVGTMEYLQSLVETDVSPFEVANSRPLGFLVSTFLTGNWYNQEHLYCHDQIAASLEISIGVGFAGNGCSKSYQIMSLKHWTDECRAHISSIWLSKQSIEDGISPEPQRIGGLASLTEATARFGNPQGTDLEWYAYIRIGNRIPCLELAIANSSYKVHSSCACYRSA